MRPNIILFFTDQLRRDVLGCYGNAVCRTPELDRLATEGVRFDNAFTTSPVCSPARASLLTGLYPHNHGVMINTHIAPAWSRGLSKDVPTFSAVLREAGYALDYAGKWHVHQDKGPCEFGFDRHVRAHHSGDIVPGTEVFIDFPGGRQLVCGKSPLPKEESGPWRTTDEGIAMLRERAASDQPFFLRIDTPEPHFANVVPEPHASMYEPESIPPWPNFAESFDGKPASHLRKHREWHLEDKDWAWWRRVVAMYYGEVSLIDECVGRVLRAIRECGLEENTIFVFATDHGDALGSHRHFEKAGTMYDEIYRVPLLVKLPPSRGEPRAVSAFVRLLDLMPTFAEWAGAELPAPVDGKSVAPFLRGEAPAEWPDSVYCEHHGEVWGYHSQRMVRTRRWKYVYDPHDLDELYDLQGDPAELDNLAADPGHADVLREMKGRLLGWNDDTKDMFRWSWVRWNFPEPLPPLGANSSTAPLTSG